MTFTSGTAPLRHFLLSLRGRMLVGFIIGWLVLSAAILHVGQQTSQTVLRESNLQLLRYAADVLAADLSAALDSRIAALERLAVQLDGIALEEAPLRRRLTTNDALLELFEALVVADSQGRVLADWPVAPGRTGLDIQSREYFRFVKQVKRPYVSAPLFGQVRGVPLVLLVVPLLDDRGQFLGMVGGVLDLDGDELGLLGTLASTPLAEDGFTSLFTAEGMWLHHSDPRQLMAPTPSARRDGWLDLARDGWEGEVVLPGMDGSPALQAYRQIWRGRWIVRLSLPEAALHGALADRSRQLFSRLGYSALALLTLVALLIMAAFRPLHRLERQLGEAALGQRHHLALRTSVPELRRTASAYNRLADARRKALQHLEVRRAFLNSVLDASPIATFVTDVDGQPVLANSALKRFRAQHPAAPGEWSRLRRLLIEQLRRPPSLPAGEARPHQEVTYQTADGETGWLDVQLGPVLQEERVIGHVVTLRDVTAQRQQADQQRWQAEHDTLTGLLNRRGFERQLAEHFARWRQSAEQSAVILVDLDHFKPVNDRGGHALGDRMLCLVGKALRSCLRHGDPVARQGGDEFGVLLGNCSREAALKIAEQLRAAVAAIRLPHAGHTFQVTASIGVTLLAPDDRDFPDALARADQAVYASKAAGKNRASLHDAA